MTTIYLGNENESGKVRTTVRLPEELSLSEAFTTITDAGDGVWVNHAPRDEDRNALAPNWVATDDEALANLLSSHYGAEVRTPLPEGERNEFPEEVNIDEN